MRQIYLASSQESNIAEKLVNNIRERYRNLYVLIIFGDYGNSRSIYHLRPCRDSSRSRVCVKYSPPSHELMNSRTIPRLQLN
jgi:hypothetical protein